MYSGVVEVKNIHQNRSESTFSSDEMDPRDYRRSSNIARNFASHNRNRPSSNTMIGDPG